MEKSKVVDRDEEVEKVLKDYDPNVIILNCDAATLSKGRLIMNLDEVKKISELCPNSTIILTHFDTVNHGLITSDQAREFIKTNHLTNILVPKNGEWILL